MQSPKFLQNLNREMKPNNIIALRCTGESFYRMWVEMLTPFHKLTNRERDVMARIISQRFKLQESISDPAMLKEVLWSQTSRKDMRESLKMSQANFQMTLSKLHKAKVLVDGDIRPELIPHKGDEPRFCLQIIYDWSSKANPIDAKK